MTIKSKNYDHLIGKIEGMSDKQLKAHLYLYQGYVKQWNEIEEQIRHADRTQVSSSYGAYSELQRRRAVPFNGMVLHELFFEGLTHQSTRPSPELLKALEADFGSFEAWQEDAKAALLSASGWCLLSWCRRDRVLRHNLVEEHHRGLLVEQDVLLALDGWEHAYFMDYGTSKKDYAKVLFRSLDWDVISRRYQLAERLTLGAAAA
jgi:Fe-Mn family superoxide dismutase